MLPIVLKPPNSTALLSSIAVKVKSEHGGGFSPVVAGQLHTPAVNQNIQAIYMYMYMFGVIGGFITPAFSFILS